MSDAFQEEPILFPGFTARSIASRCFQHDSISLERIITEARAIIDKRGIAKVFAVKPGMTRNHKFLIDALSRLEFSIPEDKGSVHAHGCMSSIHEDTKLARSRNRLVTSWLVVWLSVAWATVSVDAGGRCLCDRAACWSSGGLWCNSGWCEAEGWWSIGALS